MFKFFSVILFSLTINCTVVAMNDYPYKLLQGYVSMGDIKEIIVQLEKNGSPPDSEILKKTANESGYRSLAKVFSSKNPLDNLKKNEQQIEKKTIYVSKTKIMLFKGIRESDGGQIEKGLQRIYHLGIDPAKIKNSRSQTPVELAHQLKLDKLAHYITTYASSHEGKEKEQEEIEKELIEKNPELQNAVELLFESAEWGNIDNIDKALKILAKKNYNPNEIYWYGKTATNKTRKSYPLLSGYISDFTKSQGHQQKLKKRKRELKYKLQNIEFRIDEKPSEIEQQKQELIEKYKKIKDSAEFEKKFEDFCKKLWDRYTLLDDNSWLTDFSWHIFMRLTQLDMSARFAKYKDTLLYDCTDDLLRWGMDIWEKLINKNNLLTSASEIAHYPKELKNIKIPELTEEDINIIYAYIDENKVIDIDKKIRVVLPSEINDILGCSINNPQVVNIDDETGRKLSEYAAQKGKTLLSGALKNSKTWHCFDVKKLHDAINANSF